MILLATLATYGISSLLTMYDGPWDAFIKLRDKFPFPPFTSLMVMCIYVGIPVAYLSGLCLLEYLAMIGIVAILERIV